MLTLRADRRTLWRHEYPRAASLRGSTGRVLGNDAGQCWALGAPPSRLAVRARAAAGRRAQVDRAFGRARAGRQRPGLAAIRGAKPLGVGAGPALAGATPGGRVAAGSGMDCR